MAQAKKAINKMQRKERAVREATKDVVKMNKAEEVMQASPAAQKLMRGVHRRLDKSYGYDAVGHEPHLEYKLVASSVSRFDFDPGAGFDYGIKIALPLITSNIAEVSKVTAIADLGAYEAFTITAPAGGVAAQADYFVMEAPNGDTYAFWLDIDAAGTAPTGAAYVAADNQIMVSILSTDANTDVAAAIVAEMAAVADIAVTDNLDATISVVFDLLGAHADAAPHNADDSGAGSVGIAMDVQGAASNLNSTYFLLDSPTTDYYVWFDVDGFGSDPMISGRTAIPVAISAGDAANAVASAMATEINGVAEFNAGAVGALVTVTGQAPGDTPDIADVDTGFTFSVSAQGSGDGEAFNNKLGARPGDLVQFLEGDLEGRMLAVTSVVDGYTLRLDDVPAYVGPESTIAVRVILSGVKKSFV